MKFGNYEIKNVDLGGVNIIVTGVGIETKKVYVVVTKEINIFDINVEFSTYDIDQVVVTGTKTFKRQNESPVIVNVIDSRQLIIVQAGKSSSQKA